MPGSPVAIGRIYYEGYGLLGEGMLRAVAITADEARLLEEEKRRKDEEEMRKILALFSDDDDETPATEQPSDPANIDLWRNPNWELEVDESPWRSRRVLLHGDGSWSDGEGDGVYRRLLPVYGRDYVPFDCVAWVPDRPSRWWRATKIAVCLGQDDIRSSWGKEEATIRLVATPDEWLLADLPSACVLDWRSDLRQLFGMVEHIECSTPRLATFLDKQLARQVRHKFKITALRRRFT